MSRIPTTPPTLPQIKPAALRKFHAGFAAWYQAHGRHDLPWRKTADPYAIWISEVMLQQTQVATVQARFYKPFLEKFPTIEALAQAEPGDVMKRWEGLGYYSRARNLHKAAKQLVEWSEKVGLQDFPYKDGARMPATLEELVALPGIGRNTASAILAFGFHQPVAIMEANVKRIVARIFALETPTTDQLWTGAEMLLNHAQPFDYNQAIMDLGSLICTPKQPQCSRCPAAILCKGKVAPEQFPSPKPRISVPTRAVRILVRIDANGRMALHQRGDRLLGGLWGFTQLPREESNAPIAPYRLLGSVTHVYSHFRLIADVWYETLDWAVQDPNWFTAAEMATLALSKLDHKVLALIESRHTGQKKRSKSLRPARKH